MQNRFIDSDLMELNTYIFFIAAEKEAQLSFFSPRYRDADDTVDALLRNYNHFPGDLKRELPLKAQLRSCSARKRHGMRGFPLTTN